KLDSDVAAADHEEMFGNLVEFECLDMRERLRLSKTWNRSQGGPGPRTYDYVCAAQLTGGSIRESRLHGSWGYKSSAPEDKLPFGFPVGFQIHLVHAGYHLAFSITHALHVNRVALIGDAKFLASAKVGATLAL